MNIRVDPEWYPEEWDRRGFVKKVRVLDEGVFAPAIVIPQDGLGINKLTPTDEMPRRGMGQVWRASLTSSQGTASCWVLRRIGSRVPEHDIELVSETCLRDRLGLRDQDGVEVRVEGQWRLR